MFLIIYSPPRGCGGYAHQNLMGLQDAQERKTERATERSHSTQIMCNAVNLQCQLKSSKNNHCELKLSAVAYIQH